ncbi:MAG: ATP-binding protein [Phycisphaerae bacterium]|nr:ATP-binding protein [Phycisphaerae bacterium]
MARQTRNAAAGEETLPFRIHPRAFKALGADLVTNDVVAIIELVKNAYDAYATRVDVRFGDDAAGRTFIEVQDDGSGMDRKVIEDAWSTVATPFRRDHPFASRSGRRNRRASGEKGLGRLSAARLGDELEMFTQARNQPCWRVRVNWAAVAEADDIDACSASISRTEDSPFATSGTLIRILATKAIWDDEKLSDLRDNLARLLPPFDTADDFEIHLTAQGQSEPIRIVSPEFLKHPKYAIRGEVDSAGKTTYSYAFRAIQGDGKRRASGTLTWHQVQEQADNLTIKSIERPRCGPFSFEIRAWDIAPQDTHEIAERFELKKSSVRRDIKAYKGISVYRDGVLVLPKSEQARDWLGLDLRRVGRVGPRLSTPQIVGHVAITADKNPRIEDTSDRERLATTAEVTAFEEILRSIVSVLENERDKDRRTATKEKRVVELFQQLSAKELVAGVDQVAKEGGTAEEALPLVREFSDKLDKAREEIETRFVYYSRLATVGTIAQMLVHEVRNRTTVIAHALQALKKLLAGPSESTAATQRIDSAGHALSALDKLADTFAPLASRSFRRRMRNCIVEESILRSVSMLDGEIKTKKIQVRVPSHGATVATIDPGEMDAVLLNLLSNAIYWLGQSDEATRQLEIRMSSIDDGARVRVAVHDSGPGVSEEDKERIFWPGVTNKPGGIGMGLTVAAELVSEYGGKLGVASPGKLGGATFTFDVPVKSS